MKAKVYCFGHGWACELPGKIWYVGRFEDTWQLFDEWLGQMQIQHCLGIYRGRMGTEAQTRGMA
mgnify:CR=1 FL=1